MHTSRMPFVLYVALLAPMIAVFSQDRLTRPISAAESRSLVGGADCLIDGTANCPQAQDCTAVACVRAGTTTKCPNNQLGMQQITKTFPNVQVTNQQGNTGKTNQAQITCQQQVTCNGCSGNFFAPGTCLNGGATNQPPVTRVPTTVNAGSPQCNLPL